MGSERTESRARRQRNPARIPRHLIAAAIAVSPLALAQPVTAQSHMVSGVSLLDRERILDEMARYSWAIDSGDLDAYLDRFWEGGYILHPKPDGSAGRFQGPDEIRDWLGTGFEQRPSQTYGHQHQFNAPVITAEGEDIRVQAYVMIFRHDFHRQYWPSGPSWRMGTWHALYGKRGDQWKLKSLDVRMWTDTALGAGAAIVDRKPGMPGTR